MKSGIRTSQALLAATALCAVASGGMNAQDRPGAGSARRVPPFAHLEDVRITPLEVFQMTPLQREVLGPNEGNLQVKLCTPNPELCRAYWGLVSANVIRNITIPVRARWCCSCFGRRG